MEVTLNEFEEISAEYERNLVSIRTHLTSVVGILKSQDSFLAVCNPDIGSAFKQTALKASDVAKPFNQSSNGFNCDTRIKSIIPLTANQYRIILNNQTVKINSLFEEIQTCLSCKSRNDMSLASPFPSIYIIKRLGVNTAVNSIHTSLLKRLFVKIQQKQAISNDDPRSVSIQEMILFFSDQYQDYSREVNRICRVFSIDTSVGLGYNSPNAHKILVGVIKSSGKSGETSTGRIVKIIDSISDLNLSVIDYKAQVTFLERMKLALEISII